MSFVLTMQPNLVMDTRSDGKGFDLRATFSDNHGQLQIGNVSIAFDDRNILTGGHSYSGLVVQLGPLTDDPVRLDNRSVTDGDSPEERLLYALAADLGYKVEKEG